MSSSVVSPSPLLEPDARLRLQPPVPAQMRAALGSFATGVTIVSARDATGRLVGLTANSFNAVSLQPPLVLWSLALSSASLATFSACTHYTINVLSADQQALAERFASKGVDRWSGVRYSDGAHGAPVLDGAAAVFECFNRSRYDEGDHVIFVGEVLHCAHREGVLPLLYHGSRFYAGLPG